MCPVFIWPICFSSFCIEALFICWATDHNRLQSVPIASEASSRFSSVQIFLIYNYKNVKFWFSLWPLASQHLWLMHLETFLGLGFKIKTKIVPLFESFYISIQCYFVCLYFFAFIGHSWIYEYEIDVYISLFRISVIYRHKKLWKIVPIEIIVSSHYFVQNYCSR